MPLGQYNQQEFVQELKRRTAEQGSPNCYNGPAGVQRVKKNENQKSRNKRNLKVTISDRMDT